MSQLLSFIGTKSFDEVKKAVKELNLEIKSAGNMYMILFKDNCDFTDIRVRQASGMILEKETNKLLHFSFEKCYDGIDGDWASLSNDPYNKQKLESKDYSVELFFEGSIIKVFYYEDKWNIATSKQIEGHKNRWSSRKTYDILFAEAVENTYNLHITSFFETLDKNCCHTFLLQHPENILAHPVGVPTVYYVNKVNLETLEEETPEKENLTVNKTIAEIINDSKQNYMVYVKNDQGKLDRIKCLTTEFADLIKLRGDYPDIGLSYLASPSQQELFYAMFPQEAETFDLIEKLLNDNAYSIYFLYKRIHVQKQHVDIPKRLIRTLSQLHGQYKKTKTPITEKIVKDKLLSLEPKTLAYVIGYKY